MAAELSIIIPTYNSAKTIKRCLDSIICQSFESWEVLVMDGQSNDDTLSVIDTYKDKRIKIFSEPDDGIYDAMNKGIHKSNGEWLYFLGSDDWLYDNTVLSRFIRPDFLNYDILYGDIVSDVLAPQYHGKWSIQNIEINRCHQSIFYNRKVFELLGDYDLRFKLAADHCINIKWLLNNQVRKHYIDYPVAFFSDGGFSSSFIDEEFDSFRDYLIIRMGICSMPHKQYSRYCKSFIKGNHAFKEKVMVLGCYIINCLCSKKIIL